MIEELKPIPIIDRYGAKIGDEAPTARTIMNKVNEIIEAVNSAAQTGKPQQPDNKKRKP